MVNDKKSSKSYAKKYWGTHVRPLKGTKLRPPEPEPEKVKDEREGRAKSRDGDRPSDNATSCPPTQSRLSFDWGNAPGGVRHGRSRSRSRRRAVSFSPMRVLTSIAESDVEDEEEEEGDGEDGGENRTRVTMGLPGLANKYRR